MEPYVLILGVLVALTGFLFWRLLAPARALQDASHVVRTLAPEENTSNEKVALQGWRQFWGTVGDKAGVSRTISRQLWWGAPAFVVSLTAVLTIFPFFRPFPLALVVAIDISAIGVQLVFSRALSGSVVELEDVRRFFGEILTALNNPETGSFATAIAVAWEEMPAGALRDELSPVVDDITNNARSVTEALHGLAQKTENRDVKALCSQLVMAVQAGADPGPSIELAAVALDDRVSAIRAIRTRIADAKTTAMIARFADPVAIIGGFMLAGSLTFTASSTQNPSPWAGALGFGVATAIAVIVFYSERAYFSTVYALVKREA